MDEEKTLMEEYVCGDPKVDIRVGDEYQAEVPPLISESERAAAYLSNPLASESNAVAVGLPVDITWIDTKLKDDVNVDMNESLKSLKTKRNRRVEKMNLEAVPERPSSSWEDLEVDAFVLGLYTFGKNFAQVKTFLESKETGELLSFYYGKFYKSSKHKIWSNSLKKRSRKCIQGKKLYSGWRLHLLLSRLMPSITDESSLKTKLVNVSKSLAEGNTSLEKYITAVKELVGLRSLVEAVAIGKDKEDLTVLTTEPVKSKQWFTVSSSAAVPAGLGVYSSLTCDEIIEKLSGGSRLSKARCNDIFWEAVWPRLLARGWHSEQPKDRSYITSKDNIVFIVPGVKRFSRGELVKGDHYFDSVSDILTKVASEPELLEVETGGGGEIVNESVNSSDQSDEELRPSDSQRHRYLKSPSSSRGNLQMRFTVVDTSLASGGKLCDLRNLKVSETKTGLGDKDSSSLPSQNVEMPSLDAPMRFVIVDTSLDHRKKWSGLRRWKRLPSDGRNKDDSSVKEEEESLERVKDPSKRLIKKHRAEDTNHHSVKSAPSLKRRRLSACVKREKSLSKEDPESDSLSLCAVQHKNSTVEEMSEDKERYENVDYMKLKSDQSEKTGTGPSSAVVETQEMSETKPNGLCSVSGEDNDCSPEEVRTSHELISSEHHSNGLCSASGSDKGRVSIDTEQEQEVELHQKATIDHPVNTQELGSSEQQEANTDAPRRHSTRKRPLTTRALEALESCLLTTEIMETTVKPRKRERSSRKKHSAKVSNRAQLLPDNGITDKEQRGGEDGSKATASNNPLDQIEDTKPSFIHNGATTESSKPPLDRRHDSKPALTEHPKLPPIILKLSLKRSRASET